MNQNKPDIFDRIMMLPGLRVFNKIYVKYKSVLLYVFFGGLTTLISIATFYLFDTVIGLNELIANIISWIFAVLFAFFTNRKWVFDSSDTKKGKTKEFFSFIGGRLLTLLIEEIMLFAFVTCAHFNSNLIKIIAQVVVFVSNYIISKLFVFRSGKKK